MAGRKSLFKEEFIMEAYELCLMGYIDTQLAEVFEVHVDTLQGWKRAHPEFKQAIHNAKAKADAAVAHSLYKNAKGHTKKDGTEVAGDVNAQKWWLMNRQRDLWTDKKEVKMSGSIDLSAKTDEELKEIIAQAAKDSE